MKKEDIIKRLESDKGDTEFVLRTSDEEKSFLDNYGKSVLEKELDPKVAEIHNRYDDDLFQITGERKKPGEKTYKFMKDKFTTLKEKADRVEQLEGEIESLKKGSPEMTAKLSEIKSLQGQIDKMRQDYEQKITDMAKQNLKNGIKSEIERGLLGIKIKSEIPESMKQMFIDKTIEDLSANAEMRDGKIVFLDAEGKALRDPQTMAPFTADAILKDRLKDVIDNGRKVPGPGLPPVPGKKPGDADFIMPDTVTSREKLGEWLITQGIKRNSQEYRDAYSKYGEKLPAFDAK